MIDFDKYTLDIDCPKCDFSNPVFMRQIRTEDVIICRGCKNNIQLQDYMGSFQTGLKQIQSALDELQKLSGVIEIKL